MKWTKDAVILSFLLEKVLGEMAWLSVPVHYWSHSVQLFYFLYEESCWKSCKHIADTWLILDVKILCFFGNLAATAVFKLLYVTRIQVVSLPHVNASDLNIVNSRIF